MELETNAMLKKDFGPFCGDDKWGASSIVIPRYKTRIMCVSRGESLRGVIHESHRPDLVICDDIEDLDSVQTVEARNKTYDWFNRDIIPIGSSNSNTKFIIISNLLHEDCLVRRLRDEIIQDGRTGLYKEYPLLDKNNNCLWPAMFPTSESIEVKRKFVGERVWEQEYLLHILDINSQIFRAEDFRYYDKLPLCDREIRFELNAVSIDPAFSEKESADCTAMVIGKVYIRNGKREIYILPFPVNEKMDPMKIIDRAKILAASLGDKYETLFYVENTAAQIILSKSLIKEGLRADEFKTGGMSKYERMLMASSWIKEGRVLFPKTGCKQLIKQVIYLGKGHDDLADALSCLVLKTSEKSDYTPIPPKTEEERRRDYESRPFTAGLRDMKF